MSLDLSYYYLIFSYITNMEANKLFMILPSIIYCNAIISPITAPYNVELIGLEVIGQAPDEHPINL